MRAQQTGLAILMSLALIPVDAGTAAAQAKSCCPAGDCCLPDDPERTDLALSVLLPTLAVQRAEVVFREPVQVLQQFLMGRYVIEHDERRMARGEPCTHIYEAAKPAEPVVVFHCTHLERPVAPESSVVLTPGPYSTKTLSEFQFAGDAASHGVPRAR